MHFYGKINEEKKEGMSKKKFRQYYNEESKTTYSF
jgi:hypothetical protein